MYQLDMIKAVEIKDCNYHSKLTRNVVDYGIKNKKNLRSSMVRDPPDKFSVAPVVMESC